MENLEKDKPKYTPEQETAIKKTGNNILVSAGAGSGKTSVLVERIIYKILYAQEKTNIDELLVVTFTNAAASEMKERILARIENELELNPEDKFLQEQIIRINKANISTIDSFCLKVVKENFKIIDIEPNFRIGESSEINLIKEEALENFLEEYYEKSEEWFYELLDAFSSKYDDTSFKEVFWEIYEQAQNSPYPQLWLKDSYNMYNINNKDEYFNSKIFEKIINFSEEVLEVSLKIKEQIMNLLKGKEEKDSDFIEFLNKDYLYTKKSKDGHIIEERQGEFLQLERAYKFLKNRDIDNFYEQMSNIVFYRIKSSKNKEVSDEIRKLMDKNREIVKNLKENFFQYNIETIILNSNKIYNIMKNFCNLIIEFDKYYLDIKKKKSIYTFNDISHFCLKILIDINMENLNSIDEYLKNKKPSIIAQNYSNIFKEIIIDEYQDSNLIQEEIFSVISNNNNRFMVGDIKQCIYRFRQANTSIFNEKYLNYKNNNLNGERIDLNANFRSTKTIIDSINIIFERLMSFGLGEVDYNEEAKLKKITPDDILPEKINISQNCDLYIIDTTNYEENSNKEINLEVKFDDSLNSQDNILLEELKDMEIEAHFIAKKIKNLIEEEKLNIKKGKEYLPLEYKDIVILTRNNQFGPIASKILDEYKIPVFSINKSNFYDILEIDIMLNILRIIDNPLQDIPLISVLYSTMFDFNANELLEIKINGKSKYYYNCLLNYLKEDIEFKDILKNKIRDFLEKIEQWRNLSKVLSINELLSYIYKDSNYYNYVGLLKNGKIRQANLFNLLEKSISFENNNSHSIFEFVNYVEKLKNNVGKEKKEDSDANLFSENENVVRIMTIHKSKGLEFPVVFISNLSKKFNMLDTTNKISFDSELKLGSSIIFNNDKENEFSRRFKINSIQRKVINEKIKRDTYSEEVRILYVALTRAKEKLILTGCISSTGNSVEEKENNFNQTLDKLKDLVLNSQNLNKSIFSPVLFTYKSPTYLSWIYSVLKSYNENTNWNIELIKKEDIFKQNLKQEEKLKDIKINFKDLFEIDKNIKYSSEFDSINFSLNWEYPYEYDKTLDSNLTVSEIKRKNDINFEDYYSTKIISDEFDEATYNFPKFYMDREETVSPLIKGTLYHIALYHLDLKINDIKEIDEYLNLLENKGIITLEHKNILDKYKILDFLKSNLADRIRNASYISKEMPFKLGLNPKEIYRNKDYDNISSTIIVNGIIDLFFEENGEIVLVDYKTDKENNDEIIKERYKLQLEIYKKAIERATGKKVKESILYLILHGKEIRL